MNLSDPFFQSIVSYLSAVPVEQWYCAAGGFLTGFLLTYSVMYLVYSARLRKQQSDFAQLLLALFRHRESEDE